MRLSNKPPKNAPKMALASAQTLAGGRLESDIELALGVGAIGLAVAGMGVVEMAGQSP
jgi:hypothetical protein